MYDNEDDDNNDDDDDNSGNDDDNNGNDDDNNGNDDDNDDNNGNDDSKRVRKYKKNMKKKRQPWRVSYFSRRWPKKCWPTLGIATFSEWADLPWARDLKGSPSLELGDDETLRAVLG